MGNIVKQHPLVSLSRAEEIALVKSMWEGTEKERITARTKFIESNMPLVNFFAAKCYKKTNVPFDSLVREGSRGLMKAIERWDYKKDDRFSVYAGYWIQSMMQTAPIKQTSLLSTPTTKAQSNNGGKKLPEKKKILVASQSLKCDKPATQTIVGK